MTLDVTLIKAELLKKKKKKSSIKKIKVFFEKKKIYIYKLEKIASSTYTFPYLDCNSEVVTFM